MIELIRALVRPVLALVGIWLLSREEAMTI